MLWAPGGVHSRDPPALALPTGQPDWRILGRLLSEATVCRDHDPIGSLSPEAGLSTSLEKEFGPFPAVVIMVRPHWASHSQVIKSARRQDGFFRPTHPMTQKVTHGRWAHLALVFLPSWPYLRARENQVSGQEMARKAEVWAHFPQFPDQVLLLNDHPVTGMWGSTWPWESESCFPLCVCGGGLPLKIPEGIVSDAVPGSPSSLWGPASPWTVWGTGLGMAGRYSWKLCLPQI